MNNTEHTAWNAAESNRRIDLLFRIGTIVEAKFEEKGYSEEEVNWTNEDKNNYFRGPLYRVEMADNKTYWMPMLALRAGKDQSYWALEIGEQVAVLAASGDPMQSVIIGALYQDTYRPPVGLDDGTSDKRPWRASVKRERFADNTIFEYDREKHRFTASFLSAEDNQFQYQGDTSVRKLSVHIKEIDIKNDENTKVDADGTIAYKSGGNMTLESDSDITETASGKIDIGAGSNVNIKGSSNVNIEAGSSVSIKGATVKIEGGTIEVEGGSVKITGGTVDVKGMINLN